MAKYQAILMAAGVGSRISTYIHQPKSTLDLGEDNETIVEHTLKMLAERDFDVNMIVGFQKEKILDLLADYDVRFFDNPFYRATNSIGSLWFARQALVEAAEKGQDVILTNADVFWSHFLLDKLLADDSDFVLLADKSRVTVGDYFFKLDEDGYVIDNGKGMAVEDRSCEYVGVGKVSAKALPTFIEHLDALIWDEKYNMWWEDVMYSYKTTDPIKVIDTEGDFWGEVDTIEDYQRLLDYVKNRKH